MKIGLNEFRAFAKTGPIDVRPLTFLVGENSAGKTSFLAALNYIWRFQQRTVEATFSLPPFDLGTFDELVHRVRGRTRPARFSLEAENNIVVDARRGVGIRISGQPERITGRACLTLSFSNNVGEARLASLSLIFNERRLEVHTSDDLEVKIFNNDKLVYDSTNKQGSLDLSSGFSNLTRLDFNYISLLLRRIIIEQLSTNNKTAPPHVLDANIILGAFEALSESFPRSIFAGAPVRTSPSRVYTPADQSRSPEGRHTPQVLFKIKETDAARWQKIKAGLENFGQLSGMFSKIDVARYRKSGSSPFQINITLKGKQSNLVDVGYGVSQALPILTDLIEAGPKSAFLFQQPEVHLHPQAQAALGSFFSSYVVEHRDSYIIAETHSDYMIDRVRYEVKQGNIRPNDVSILYFESEGTDVTINQIGIDEGGNIINAPHSYRDFFILEQIKILGLEN